MREIKFRAWNIKYKLYEDITDLYWFEEEFVHSFDDERFVFEQYTGLKDKNGKEIFEGDILASGSYKKAGFVCGEMKWDDREAAWGKFWPLSQFEVIGNIHENPELMA